MAGGQTADRLGLGGNFRLLCDSPLSLEETVILYEVLVYVSRALKMKQQKYIWNN
jgi:hypothetical protein